MKKQVAGLCELCGKPMPAGEEMFRFHGFSGDCPLPKEDGVSLSPHYAYVQKVREEKYVRLMLDYCAEGLWAKDGSGIHPKTLPISNDLQESILKWNAAFDVWANKGEHKVYTSDIDDKVLNAWGKILYEALIEELPDWKISFKCSGIGLEK